MCFRNIGRFHVNNVYICTSITNIVYMSDRQQFIIDCTSLIPVIGTLVLIKIANEQMVTMVAAYVLCGELLGVLISRILRLSSNPQLSSSASFLRLNVLSSLN